MSRVEIREERCKGCLLCTLVCPEHMLTQSDRMNAAGYKVVGVRDDLREACKGCGFCAEICPDYVITVFRTVKDKEKQET